MSPCSGDQASGDLLEIVVGRATLHILIKPNHVLFLYQDFSSCSFESSPLLASVLSRLTPVYILVEPPVELN